MKNFNKSWIMAPLVGFILITAFQCIEAPLEPVAPASEIQLSIPLLDITRTFANFTVKDTLLKREPNNGTYTYTTSQSAQPINIDTIKATPQPSEQSVTLGLFSVDPLPPTSQNLTLSKLGLTPIDYPGPPMPPFPSQSVVIEGQTFDFNSQFGYVAIKSGTITLRITNNLPLTMTYTKPIILRNNKLTSPIDTSTVAVFEIGVVDSFSTVSRTASLGGKMIQGLMKTDSVSFVTSERSDAFSLKNNHGISFQFNSTSLEADSASAVIPDQTVYSINDSTFVVDDTVAIRHALFSKGKFNVLVTNRLDINVSVYIKFKELKSRVRRTDFTYYTTMNRNSILNIPVSLDTLEIATDGTNPLGTVITYSVGINTITSLGEKRNVTKYDFVRAELQPQGALVVKEITGKIKPMALPIYSAMPSNFQLGELSEMFNAKLLFSGIVLKVNLPITGGFPTDYNLSFIAKNTKTNYTDSIILPPIISTGIRRLEPNVGTQTIQISGPAFDQFLNGICQTFPILPDSFYIRGSINVNPEDVFASNNYYSIYDTTKIYPSFNILFPLDIGIENGRLIETSVLEAKGLLSKDFTKNIGYGALNFHFTNNLPMEVRSYMRFLKINTQAGKNDTILRIPIDSSDFIRISPSNVDPNTRYSTTPTISKFEVKLTGPQIEAFQEADSIYLRLDLGTPAGTSTGTVKIRSTDNIRVWVSGKMLYTINKP